MGIDEMSFREHVVWINCFLSALTFGVWKESFIAGVWCLVTLSVFYNAFRVILEAIRGI